MTRLRAGDYFAGGGTIGEADICLYLNLENFDFSNSLDKSSILEILESNINSFLLDSDNEKEFARVMLNCMKGGLSSKDEQTLALLLGSKLLSPLIKDIQIDHNYEPTKAVELLDLISLSDSNRKLLILTKENKEQLQIEKYTDIDEVYVVPE